MNTDCSIFPSRSSYYSSQGTFLYVLQHPGRRGCRADVSDVRRNISEVRGHVRSHVRANVRAVLGLHTVRSRKNLTNFHAQLRRCAPRGKSMVG